MATRRELNEHALPIRCFPTFAVDQHFRISGLHADGDGPEPIARLDLELVAHIALTSHRRRARRSRGADPGPAADAAWERDAVRPLGQPEAAASYP